MFPRIWLENLGLHTCCASDLTSTYPSYQRGIWGWNYPQLFKFATFCYVKVILYQLFFKFALSQMFLWLGIFRNNLSKSFWHDHYWPLQHYDERYWRNSEWPFKGFFRPFLLLNFDSLSEMSTITAIFGCHHFGHFPCFQMIFQMASKLIKNT